MSGRTFLFVSIRASNRGAFYQQNFTVSQIDFGAAEYKIPLEGGEAVPQIVTEEKIPEIDTTRGCNKKLTEKSPVIPGDKTEYTPKEKTEQDKGRTITYENLTY